MNEERFKFRAETARLVMLKMLEGCATNESYPDPDEVCGMAVLYADTLIENLLDNAD